MIRVAGVRVWSLKADKGEIPKDAVYVGRPTTFGNPFSHLKGEGIVHVKSVAEAVSRFRKYATEDNPGIANLAIKELAGKDLVCWCSKPPCHAAVLAEIAAGKKEAKS